MKTTAKDRDLVLVGGGHTHALLIRRLGMQPIPGVRVTLVSESRLTPYSGMLPGLVAGHYTFADTHIDLNRLCQRTGVRFVVGRVEGIDAEHQSLIVQGQPALSYDAVSIDTGSTPNLNVPGAREHGVGVKPVSHFTAEWEALLPDSDATDPADASQPQHWGVVGAGAGGVELVLAMAYRLRHRPDLHFHLIYPGTRPLNGSPGRVVAAAEQALAEAGVQTHPGFKVAEVTAEGVVSASGETLTLNQTVLCTPASAPNWPGQAGLDTANGGFIAVNEFLQSTSHRTVFAAGDVAEMTKDPRPKAGVYAVRQAPTLHHNLRHFFAGTAMEPLKLQKDFLSLLSLGEQKATGSRNGLVFTGRWVWRWKNKIDRDFMTALNDFRPPPTMSKQAGTDAPTQPVMHCAGCGSKLGPALLQDTLAELPAHTNPAINAALGAAEDAMVWTPTPGTLSVQSVDGFRAFSTDLYRLGQVSVHHALSDLYAMNATPVSAQVWVNLDFNHPRLQQRDFRRLMRGIAEALVANACTLGGGHSTEGEETHVSVTANGEVAPDQVWRKSGARAGDWLVLTKPLGTGVILAADSAGDAPAEAVAAAWHSMLRSNRSAAAALQPWQPSAVTDVTGFGLLGHLLEMLTDDNVQAHLDAAAIPALPQALALLEAGWESSLTPALQHLLQECELSTGLPAGLAQLLLDPQTSGGLLAAIPAPGNAAPPGLPGTVIGRLTGKAAGAPRVTLSILSAPAP